MILIYSALAFGMFFWAAILPARAAMRQRATMRFDDQMRAIEVKYSRLAYPVLNRLSSEEIEMRYGLERTYRSIKARN